jgi:hypothetical protein
MVSMILFKNILCVAILSIFSQSNAFADEMPRPDGDIILTLSGEITNTNTEDGRLELDLVMLQAMPVTKFKTNTIWLEKAVEFTGVNLKAILDYAGASGTLIHAIALNDYKVDIPADTVDADAPLVAYHIDGEIMSTREKGPLWVVYPYDQDAKYRTEVVYSRSIWQLDRLTSVQ